MRWIFTVSFITAFGALATAGTIDVPADQPSIQAAVNAAVSGDVIRINAGTYFENVVVAGKTVHLKSKGKVVIDALKDGVPKGPGLWFQAGSTGSSATRMTIRHARTAGAIGHGVHVESSNVALKQLTIQACQVLGILIQSDEAHVDKCVIEGCNGGINSTGDYVTVERTTVRNDGAFGMMFSSKGITLKNNRIETIEDGPGLVVDAGASTLSKLKFKNVTDGIAVDLVGDELELIGCDIEGGTHGDPAIRVDGQNNRLVGNRVRDVSDSAVVIVSGSKETNLTKNRFERCGTEEEPTLELNGLYNRLFSNRITDADGRGIYITDSSELQGNVVKNGRRDGIHVAVNVATLELRKNVVTGCLGEGFDLRSAPDEIVGNVAKKNRIDFVTDLVLLIPISNSFGTTGVPDVE